MLESDMQKVCTKNKSIYLHKKSQKNLYWPVMAREMNL